MEANIWQNHQKYISNHSMPQNDLGDNGSTPYSNHYSRSWISTTCKSTHCVHDLQQKPKKSQHTYVISAHWKSRLMHEICAHRRMPCDEKRSHAQCNIYIYIYQALLIDENNEKPSHSLTISLKSRAISLFGEETGWNSMCLLKGELATTKLYAKEKKNWREKKKKNKRTQN